MKTFALVFAILLVSASAVPRFQFRPELAALKTDERFVDGIIVDVIADAVQSIKDAGLDPLRLHSWHEAFSLPVTDLVNVETFVESFELFGLSDIVINSINYGLLTSRLQFNISLPRIAGSFGRVKLDGEILGLSANAAFRGNFAIVQTRMVGDIRISIGILTGISISSLSLDFSLADIECNMNVEVLGSDWSDSINLFFGDTLPGAIANSRPAINELIEYYVWQIADELL